MSWDEDSIISQYIPHWDYDIENSFPYENNTQAVRPGKGLLCVDWGEREGLEQGHTKYLVTIMVTDTQNISAIVRYVNTLHTFSNKTGFQIYLLQWRGRHLKSLRTI